MAPVDIVRDPRIGRLWTKYKETDLPVPKFKVSDRKCDARFFHVEKGGCQKLQTHPPSLIFGMWSESMNVGGL